jgi:hypothetical protein
MLALLSRLHKIKYNERLLFNAKWAIIQLQVIYPWDDEDVRLLLDQLAELDFYSVNLLKQQSVGRHVAPLRHIILTNTCTCEYHAIVPYLCGNTHI